MERATKKKNNTQSVYINSVKNEKENKRVCLYIYNLCKKRNKSLQNLRINTHSQEIPLNSVWLSLLCCKHSSNCAAFTYSVQTHIEISRKYTKFKEKSVRIWDIQGKHFPLTWNNHENRISNCICVCSHCAGSWFVFLFLLKLPFNRLSFHFAKIVTNKI